jgi:hypothetical protein
MNWVDLTKSLGWGGTTTSDHTGVRFCALAGMQTVKTDRTSRIGRLISLQADKSIIQILVAMFMWLIAAYTDYASAQSGLFHDTGALRPVEPSNWLIGSWSVVNLPQCQQIPFEVKMAETAQTHVAQIFDPVSGQHFLIKSFRIVGDEITAEPLFFPTEPFGTKIVAKRISETRISVETRFGPILMERCEIPN